MRTKEDQIQIFTMVKNLFLVLFFFIGIVFSIFFLSTINFNSYYQKVYAHMFTLDDTASFLAFADQLQVESELIKTNPGICQYNFCKP
jgi:hypothetical protein